MMHCRSLPEHPAGHQGAGVWWRIRVPGQHTRYHQQIHLLVTIALVLHISTFYQSLYCVIYCSLPGNSYKIILYIPLSYEDKCYLLLGKWVKMVFLLIII